MEQEEFEDKLRQGMELMSLQKYAEAEQAFASLLDVDGKNVEVYINLANAQLNQDKIDEGIATFKKALLLDEHNDEVLSSLGCAYFLKLDYANALRYFNQVENAGKATAGLYSIEAAIFLDSEDYNMAIRSINRAIQLEPLNTQLRLDKAQIYEQQGRIGSAVTTLHELQEVLPDEGAAYAYEAQLLMDAGRYDEALSAIDRAEARFPADPELVLLRAKTLNYAGRYEEALAAAMDGSDLVHEGGDSEGDAGRARELQVQTGIALGGLGRIEESIAVLERLAREGGGTRTYFLILNESLALKRYEEVLEYAGRILEDADADPRIRAAGIFYRPFALEKLGRGEEALPLYKEAVGQLRRITIGRPFLFEVYAYRVMTHMALGQYDDALELADYIISLDDTAPASYALKYQVAKAKGDTAEAKALRSKVLVLDPTFELEEEGV